MTPDPEAKKAKLEAILGRLRANRTNLGHPGAALPPSTDSVEPVTLPLHAAHRPGPAVAVAAAPAPLVEVAPPPPPLLPSTTVSPTVAPVSVAAAAPVPAPAPAEPEEEVRPQRIEAVAPVEAPVVRTSGAVVLHRPRTIGELLGAALRLFEKS
jgi:hypothetical protein